MISFKATREESLIISKITKRALAMASEQGVDIDPMTMHMDITACHANGCPLKLAELLDASNFEFAHDVFGIRRHVNRQTGKLEDCFLPRYAA